MMSVPQWQMAQKLGAQSLNPECLRDHKLLLLLYYPGQVIQSLCALAELPWQVT